MYMEKERLYNSDDSEAEIYEVNGQEDRSDETKIFC